ncbi:MAG: hypothetical protein ACXV3V_05065 [Actinomycetes bacterium]
MKLRLKQLAQDGAVKGALAVYDGTSWVVLAPGVNGQVLTVDSSAATGLRWSSTSTPIGYSDTYSDTYADAATGLYSDLYNGSY